jgi:2-haloacid dehalogenase
VFGPVVDWRASIARESALFLAQIDREDVAPDAFADAWRGRYVPAMATVREGHREWVVLDVLHREMLEDTLRQFDCDPRALDSSLLAHWTLAWLRLDPWPDAAAGLASLKTQWPVVTLSNGNVALLVTLSRYAGLSWDAILGAEFAGVYKPDPRAYLGTAKALGVEPGELCLVASHHSDLSAARACGLLTAYIHRPLEYGGRPAPDLSSAQDWDYSTDSIESLAHQLDCAR